MLIPYIDLVELPLLHLLILDRFISSNLNLYYNTLKMLHLKCFALRINFKEFFGIVSNSYSPQKGNDAQLKKRSN